jgi:hypothetical protein
VVAVSDADGRVLLAGGYSVELWNALSGEPRGALPVGRAIDLHAIDRPGEPSILVSTGGDEIDELCWATVPGGTVHRARLSEDPRIIAAHAEAGVPVVYLAFGEDDDRRVERWRLDLGGPAGTFASSLVAVFSDGAAWWAINAEDGDLMIEHVPPVTR